MCQKNPAPALLLLMISACRQKMRRIVQPVCWRRLQRERIVQRPFGEMAGERLQIHRMRRVAGQDVVFVADEVNALMQA
jgi:hypothetical protein